MAKTVTSQCCRVLRRPKLLLGGLPASNREWLAGHPPTPPPAGPLSTWLCCVLERDPHTVPVPGSLDLLCTQRTSGSQGQPSMSTLLSQF